jgi:hypothetical protein
VDSAARDIEIPNRHRTTPEGIRFGCLAVDVDVLLNCEDIEDFDLEIAFGLVLFIACLLPLKTAQDVGKHLQSFAASTSPRSVAGKAGFR